MTIQIHMTLSAETQAKIVAHLEEHVRPHLVADVSNFARGRQRVWLPYEAPLSKMRNWEKALQDDKLWNWIRNQCAHIDGFNAVTCLISRGGNINPHRDATYAGFKAIGINLGPVTWRYWDQYDYGDWKYNAPTRGVYEARMTGGEVFSFNPKNQHSAIDAADDRWSINAWELNPKDADRFHVFMKVMASHAPSDGTGRRLRRW